MCEQNMCTNISNLTVNNIFHNHNQPSKPYINSMSVCQNNKFNSIKYDPYYLYMHTSVCYNIRAERKKISNIQNISQSVHNIPKLNSKLHSGI